MLLGDALRVGILFEEQTPRKKDQNNKGFLSKKGIL